MKTIIMFVLAVVSYSAIAQEIESKEKDIVLIGQVMDKIKDDQVALEHFLFAGRIRCYKALGLQGDSRVDYDLKWLGSGSLNYPLLSLIKPANLIGYFDENMQSNIHKKKRELARRAEKFFTSPFNGIYICESLFRLNYDNIQVYKKFVSNKDNYRNYNVYKNNYMYYLKNSIITNEYW